MNNRLLMVNSNEYNVFHFSSHTCDQLTEDLQSEMVEVEVLQEHCDDTSLLI